jgi:hypothetical protein
MIAAKGTNRGVRAPGQASWTPPGDSRLRPPTTSPLNQTAGPGISECWASSRFGSVHRMCPITPWVSVCPLDGPDHSPGREPVLAHCRFVMRILRGGLAALCQMTHRDGGCLPKKPGQSRPRWLTPRLDKRCSSSHSFTSTWHALLRRGKRNHHREYSDIVATPGTRLGSPC